MITIDLEKKITQKKEDIVLETQKLLETAEQEDRRILNNLGLNSVNVSIENKIGAKIERERMEKDFHGRIIPLSEIKQLAIDYKLRFLNTTKFIGLLDIEVAAKIKEFSQKTNVSIDEHTLKTKFYILAPPESFHLNDIVERAKEKEREEELKKRIERDPVLFYKIDDDNYRFIHKWGKDFSSFRRVLGWKWSNPSNKRTFFFLSSLPFITFIVAIIFGKYIITSPFIFLSVILGIASIVCCFLNGGTTKPNSSDHFKEYFTPFNFNKE